MYQASGMHRVSVSSKGTVCEERIYHTKVGAHFHSQGSQPCRQHKRHFERICSEVRVWIDSTVVFFGSLIKGARNTLCRIEVLKLMPRPM